MVELVESRVALADLAEIICGYRYRFVDERDLQDGIEQALRARSIDYCREKALSAPDRPDFLVDGIAVEVKVKGSLADLLRQIGRYASHDAVRGILVVGTTVWVPKVPGALFGKPVEARRLVSSLL